MAIAFIPSYTLVIDHQEINSERFLFFAFYAATKLNWNLSYSNESGFFAYTNFSIFSWSEKVSITVENNKIKLKSECAGVQLLDFGKNKRNIFELLSKIDEVKSEMSEEEVEQKLNDFVTSNGDNNAKNTLNLPWDNEANTRNFSSIFKPTKGHFITPLLIIINVLVFIAMVISGVHLLLPEAQDLISWGANYLPLTFNGQAWRLLTSIFLHIGFLHLLFNMYALLYIGVLLEPYLGKARFLAAYLISGIIASVVSMQWNAIVISAGASGAIFGMYGVFLALLTSNILDKAVKKAFFTSIVVFVAYNIFTGLIPENNIDNAAHIGGLISGIVIGYAFVPGLKQLENKKINYSTIGILTTLLLVYLSSFLSSAPQDFGKYEQEMDRFTSMEAMALDVYTLPEGSTDEEIINELKNRGLYYWNENLKIIEGVKKLNLPTQLQERNQKLEEYCNLRIACYEVIIKAIEDETDQYEDEILNYDLKINEIIKELKGK